jgi:hypothetical protein
MLAFRYGEIMRKSLLLVFSGAIAFGMGNVIAAEESPPSVWDNFSLGGYSSAELNVHPGGSTEGSINEIGLLLSWENESRFRFLMELDLDNPITFNDDKVVVARDSYLNLERLYLDYNLSEKLNLRTGRFLTPAGRWNLVHAEPLVWTSSRPLATNRLFPKAINGLMFYGAMPVADDNAFEYSFYIEGLKDQIVREDEILFEDTKGARFTFTGKVNLGLSILQFKESIPTEPSHRLLGLDFLVKQDSWEFSGEVFKRFDSHYRDGGSGAYLQGVAPLGNQLFAVARVENYKHPVEGSSERFLLGGAWKMTPSRIFKVEYIGGDEERPESPKGLLASFAILY